ncbi:hypothetical protein P3S68_002187 [Capsicum galapagoense]
MGRDINEFNLVPETIISSKITNETNIFRKNIVVSTEELLLHKKLNTEQKKSYDTILRRIFSDKPGKFFIDGPGGNGKTFLYCALLATVRSKGFIALATTTSGVAASLLPRGRTAHSRFKYSINIDEKFTCNISKQSSLASLIRDAKLIVWDEISIAKKSMIEAFDSLLKDIMDSNALFGGKVIMFGGDFRQTLPVVRSGKKEDFIRKSILNLEIWNHLEKLHLLENMRAKLILLSVTKNDFVDELNDRLINQFPQDAKTFVSLDENIEPSDQSQFEDFLHSLNPPGLPPYILTLKENCPIILLRNLNPSEGLCNGTQLICCDFKNRVISVKITKGDFKNTHVFISIIPLLSSNDEKLPILFKRPQFSIRLCFAMKINKAQGQTLDYVGIYLREPVFSHGQLYVALSREKNSNCIKLLIRPPTTDSNDDQSTYNIVYNEIIQKSFL